MTPYQIRARLGAALAAALADPDDDETTTEEVIRLVPRQERPAGVVTLLLYRDGADARGVRTLVGLHRQLPSDCSDERLADHLEATAQRLRAGELADHPDQLRAAP
tara:strand:+ start:3151 stop:3468 length:318 start_codon:yes stop_codon:yes gene_type:complete